jgi:nucleotide-binding universal stress UspA family protein
MKILIATDASGYSNAAIDKGLEMLKTGDISIKIVSVIEPPLMTAEPFSGPVDLYRETENAVHRQAETAIEAGEIRVRERMGAGLSEAALSTEILIGSPARRIVEEAQKWEADLIVIGSHGYGFWERMMLGSVSQSVMQHAPCSVLVVRKEQS